MRKKSVQKIADVTVKNLAFETIENLETGLLSIFIYFYQIDLHNFFFV